MKKLLAFLMMTSFGYSLSGLAANKCNPPSAQIIQRSKNFLENTPCANVSTQCNAGGYYLNCHASDAKGLLADCMHPLFKGQTVAGVSLTPTDPSVGQCKAFCHAAKGNCAENKGVADR